MQTAAALTRVARECVEDLAADGVVYAEVRYAPEQHVAPGLTLDEVVAAVQQGFEEGMAGHRRIRCASCSPRCATRPAPARSPSCRSPGATGAWPASTSPAPRPATRPPGTSTPSSTSSARTRHFTIHAGEAFGLPSIWEAIQWCGADRLGHGVRIIDDITVADDGSVELGRLAAYVRDMRIPLEMCPASNVQTGAADSIAEHPIGLLTRLRFRVTVNTDNRLMSGTSMTKEFTALAEAFGYTVRDLEWFTVNAMKSAFLPFDERLALISGRDQAGVREAPGGLLTCPATRVVDADYLVVGAGAVGMAFTDALIDHADVRVALVDRRHGVGGHWLEAYPFVRLHQSSVFYGVASTVLGGGRIQEAGPEAGLQERADQPTVCAYYAGVLSDRMLASGRVEFFAGCDYVGDRTFVSRISGQRYEVSEGCRIVDTHYLSPHIPAETPPPFEVAHGARVIPVNDLVRSEEAPSQYVVVGSGKTATDACIWLLARGVDPGAICWVRPRDPWMLNRALIQPDPEVFLGMVGDMMEAASAAASLDDLFLRLEDAGIMLRIDRSVTPTMARTPTLGVWELELLRTIENVVRLGHIRSVSRGRIDLEHGSVRSRTTPWSCTAQPTAYRCARPYPSGSPTRSPSNRSAPASPASAPP